MPYVMGNDYGGLNSAGEQVDRNAANDWFRYAGMVQGLDQQQRAEQVAQQQYAQKQQEDALKWAWTRQQDLQNRAAQGRAENFQERKFDWEKTKESAADKSLKERDSEFLMRSLQPLAQDGTLNDEQMAGLLPEHKQALATIRDAARREREQQQQLLTDATEQVNAPARDAWMIAQSKQEIPHWYSISTSNPNSTETPHDQRQRMLKQIADWEAQLKDLNALPAMNPDLRKSVQALPMDEDGLQHVVPPLPWMVRRPVGLPTGTAGTPATQVGPSVSVNGRPATPIGKQVKQNGVVFTWNGSAWVPE